MKEIIDFKSNPEYFYDEKSGLKNNTERIIDINDKRFQRLLRAWKEKEYPLIRINHAECCKDIDRAIEVSLDRQYSFLRNIQHIAIWNDIMIITWKRIEAKE